MCERERSAFCTQASTDCRRKRIDPLGSLTTGGPCPRCSQAYSVDRFTPRRSATASSLNNRSMVTRRSPGHRPLAEPSALLPDQTCLGPWVPSQFDHGISPGRAFSSIRLGLILTLNANSATVSRSIGWSSRNPYNCLTRSNKEKVDRQIHYMDVRF
jgi:hypothetical protein